MGTAAHGREETIRPVATPGVAETDTMGQLSTNASGLFQVMVQPFAPAFEKPLAAKWQISTAGGAQPRWRGESKELYYMSAGRPRADAPTAAIS